MCEKLKTSLGRAEKRKNRIENGAFLAVNSYICGLWTMEIAMLAFFFFFLFCVAGQLCIIITQLCSGLSASNLRPKQDEPCFCSFILQAPVQRSTQGTSQQSAKPWPIAHTHQPRTARQTHLQWSCCFGYASFWAATRNSKGCNAKLFISDCKAAILLP